MNTIQLLIWYVELAVLITIGFGLFLAATALKRAWQDLSSASPEPDHVAPPVALQPNLRHCSLAVKKSEIPQTCCLLQNRAGKPLAGGTLSSRIRKLQRLGVLAVLS